MPTNAFDASIAPRAGLVPAARSIFSGNHAPDRSHMFAIDFARGLGALTVLVWHYQHFFFVQKSTTMSIAMEKQPLFSILSPLYDHGAYAVHFFWLISGFVFAATYMGRRVHAGDFVIARFSRLYPLHFLTLLVVALLQFVSFKIVGTDQIYHFNDAFHFVLNIFFASSWGLEKGSSFNGPIWSVSVEIIIYLLFWISFRRLFSFGVLIPLGAAASVLALRSHLPGVDAVLIANCFVYFFIGTAVYIYFRALRCYPALIVLTAVVLIVAGLARIESSPYQLANGMVIFLPGLLIAVCAFEALGHGRHLQRIRWIGDNTYGVYLWHIPIQILTLIALDYLEINRTVAESPLFLAGFLIITMLIARVSFTHFERKAQRIVRSSWEARRSPRFA